MYVQCVYLQMFVISLTTVINRLSSNFIAVLLTEISYLLATNPRAPYFIPLLLFLTMVLLLRKAKKNREKVLRDWQSRNAQANLPISIGVDHFIDHDTIIQGNVTSSDLGEYYLVDEKPVSRAINNASVRKRNKEDNGNNNKKNDNY